MTITTIGDLAQHMMLLRNNSALQANIKDRLEELGTGEVADATRHLSGDFTAASGIERALTLVDSHSSVVTSAQTFIEGQGLAFDKARGRLNETGLALLEAADSVDQTRRATVLAESKAAFEEVVAALNTTSGGRTLFAGAATQSAAFASSSQILTAFGAAVAGETTAADVMAVADAWFAPGGDYDTQAYQGSMTEMGAFRVGEGVTISAPLSGTDDAIRDLMKVHAVAAVVADGGTAMIDAEKSNLMASLGSEMLNLDDDLIEVRAVAATTETRLDRMETELSAERYALMEARKDLVGVDPAATVMHLSELEGQLESLYAMTARLSSLSLANYL